MLVGAVVDVASVFRLRFIPLSSLDYDRTGPALQQQPETGHLKWGSGLRDYSAYAQNQPFSYKTPFSAECIVVGIQKMLSSLASEDLANLIMRSEGRGRKEHKQRLSSTAQSPFIMAGQHLARGKRGPDYTSLVQMCTIVLLLGPKLRGMSFRQRIPSTKVASGLDILLFQSLQVLDIIRDTCLNRILSLELAAQTQICSIPRLLLIRHIAFGQYILPDAKHHQDGSNDDLLKKDYCLFG